MRKGAEKVSWEEKQAGFANGDGEKSASYVTALGKGLRSVDLDELPQLIQAAFGRRIRLFGPRAVQAEVVNMMWDLTASDPEKRKRFEVWLNNYYPGIFNPFNVNQSDHKDNIARIEPELEGIKNADSVVFRTQLILSLINRLNSKLTKSTIGKIPGLAKERA